MSHERAGGGFHAWDDDGNHYTLIPYWTETSVVAPRTGQATQPSRYLQRIECFPDGDTSPCYAEHVTKGRPGEYRIKPTHPLQGTVIRAESNDPAAI